MNSFGVRKGVTIGSRSNRCEAQRNDVTDIAVVEALLRDASFANALCGEFVFHGNLH